jgi:transcriptional regulator with XRE-family HTH domain
MTRNRLDKKYDTRLPDIGRRLRTVRVHANLTQEQIAATLGFSRRQWSSWEYGQNTLPVWALSQLADVFGIDPDWVIRGGSDGLRTLPPTAKADVRHKRIASKVSRMVQNLGLVVSSEFEVKLVKLVFKQPEESEREAMRHVFAMLRELALGKGTFI